MHASIGLSLCMNSLNVNITHSAMFGWYPRDESWWTKSFQWTARNIRNKMLNAECNALQRRRVAHVDTRWIIARGASLHFTPRVI